MKCFHKKVTFCKLDPEKMYIIYSKYSDTETDLFWSAQALLFLKSLVYGNTVTVP